MQYCDSNLTSTLWRTKLSILNFRLLRSHVMSALTKDQESSLEKMRQTFPDADSYGLPLNDATFQRYLRARSYDFDKASAMLASTIEWRKNFGLGEMLNKDWDEVIANENSSGKMYVRGITKGGHPILYMKPGLENSKSHDGNMKHLVYSMERVIAVGTAAAVSDKIVLLIDYDGFSLSTGPPMKTSRETLSILQNHYPERLHCAYLIRAPWVFNAFWSMIVPFIDPVTKAKVEMIKGSDIGATLTQHIDRRILESPLGGDDSRPFDSSLYLKGDFNKDFSSIVESKLKADGDI